MERPDLATLACINAECHQFRQRGQDNLLIFPSTDLSLYPHSFLNHAL